MRRAVRAASTLAAQLERVLGPSNVSTAMAGVLVGGCDVWWADIT